MTSALMRCVHAGRRVKEEEKKRHNRDGNPQDRTHRGKGGGRRPEEK